MMRRKICKIRSRRGGGKLAAEPVPDADYLRRALERAIGRAATEHDRFGIAVSGGADSLALLLLAHDAFPGRIAAATVDHGLRSDSAAEAQYVAEICAARAIPHDILRPAEAISGSLQAAARRARYALLGDWRVARGIDWLLTAHHADDQLETMVMRLARASGVGGLAGVRARQGHVLRPLLHLRRASLQQYVAAAGLRPVDDPSNRDDRFDRARIRKTLAGQDFLDPAAVAVSADALAHADDALRWATARLSAERVHRDGDDRHVDASGLPHEFVRRILIDLLGQMGVDAPRGEAIERAIAAIHGGEQAMIGNVIMRQDGNGRITLSPAPPRKAG